MAIECFGGGDGWDISCVGNPSYSDQCVVTNQFIATLVSANPNTGCWNWGCEVGTTRMLRPTPRNAGARSPTAIGLVTRLRWQDFTGTTREFLELPGSGARLAFSGSGTAGINLNLYDSAWNLLVTGPVGDLVVGTWYPLTGWELTPTQIRIWFNGTNAGWQNHGLSPIIDARYQDFRARVQTAGKTNTTEFRVDDFLVFDNSGSKFNQFPTTHPQVIELVPTSDDATFNAWETPATNKFQRIGCTHTLGTDVSTTAFNAYQMFGFQQANSVSCCATPLDISTQPINAVIVRTAFECTDTAVGNYAALENGVLYDGPQFAIQGHPVGASQSLVPWVLETTPGGLPWTVARLNAIRWGAKSLATGNPAGLLNYYRVLVLYGGAGMDAPPPAPSGTAPPVGAQVI